MRYRILAAALAAVLGMAGCSDNHHADQPPAPAGTTLSEGFATPTALQTVRLGGKAYTVAARQALLILAEDITPAQHQAAIDRLRSLAVVSVGQRLDLRMLLATVAKEGDEPAVITAMASQPGVVHAGYNHVVQTTRPNPSQPWQPPGEPARRALAARALADAPSTGARFWAGHIDLGAAHAVEDDLGVRTSPRLAVVDTGLPAGQTVLAESRVTRVDALGQALTDDSTADVKTHGRDVTAFAAGLGSSAAGVSRYASVTMVDVYQDECTGLLAALGCPLGVGRTFQTNLAEGIRTALQSDARVVNVSWGDSSECDDPQADRLAARQGWRAVYTSTVNLARRLDKLLVFSAGNNCEKRDDQLLPSAGDVAADSWASHALVVGASTAARQDALFSRMGQVVNLMAPGQGISYGAGAMDGTSFAAPLVTGSAALVQGINPQLSTPETRHLLMTGAEAVVGFADAARAAYKGYAGANAVGPKLLLNVGNSARAAKLTREVNLQTLPQVALAKGARQAVSFDVEIPTTGVRALDVVLVVDVSGSYGDDIATLQQQAGAIVDALSARGIDVQFGVSAFADFPVAPFGRAGDRAFQRLTRVTSDKASVLAGINALRLQDGEDSRESQLEALYQVATGAGRDINTDGSYDAAAGDVTPQPMGFRPGAAKVVLFATDAGFHDRDTHPAYPGAGFADTVAALEAAGIRVIALQSGGSSSAAADIGRLVAATGGASYQLSADSAQIAQAIAAGIDATLAEVEVTAEKIAGAEWITDLAQDKTLARPGEKVRFTATLQGQRSESVDGLAYDLYLWVRGNGSALIQRVRIPVQVAR